MRIPQLLGAALASLTLSTALQAAGVSAVPAGRLLASNCFQCHGTNGAGPGFDRLAGKSANEIFEEMKDFQAGKEGNGIMAKHAWGYTDEQLRALSTWLSQQPKTALRSAP
ncbi:c-type cytochrome [Ideonella paludis]|uniref:C-type cytochrome n=1 Tax=Ideonella paludis TaxID=1233411 RepID=A0ABS5E0S7_9BURK|nr:c-type cytochrome [Ideonella paludis]MBQ0936977.1 c-type cytochrome [Ideonella paludis]